MTQKQIEKAKKKIVDIKRTLAAEKKKFGAYDDSRGLRYLPTKYYIQLQDYTGGLKYLRWFQKCFPEDSGFPEFLFECTIIFFNTGKVKEAELKAFQTFCANPYWFDKFFGKLIAPLDMWHYSNIALPEYTNVLEYSSSQSNLATFSSWLDIYLSSKDFIECSTKYVDIYRRLQMETDIEMRHDLVQQAYQLKRGA